MGNFRIPVSQIHKVSKIISQTRISDNYVDYTEDAFTLIKRAEKEKELYQFKKDIYFCAYRTMFEDVPSVLFIFTMKLPGPVTGSSAATEIVMNIMRIMEDILKNIDYRYFSREVENMKHTVATLKIIKKDNEEDMI